MGILARDSCREVKAIPDWSGDGVCVGVTPRIPRCRVSHLPPNDRALVHGLQFRCAKKQEWHGLSVIVTFFPYLAG